MWGPGAEGPSYFGGFGFNKVLGVRFGFQQVWSLGLGWRVTGARGLDFFFVRECSPQHMPKSCVCLSSLVLCFMMNKVPFTTRCRCCVAVVVNVAVFFGGEGLRLRTFRLVAQLFALPPQHLTPSCWKQRPGSSRPTKLLATFIPSRSTRVGNFHHIVFLMHLNCSTLASDRFRAPQP